MNHPIDPALEFLLLLVGIPLLFFLKCLLFWVDFFILMVAWLLISRGWQWLRSALKGKL